MNFLITPYDYGARPGVTLPPREFLENMTEQGIRKMVSDHYDLLSKSEIKHLFPRIEEALEKAKQRSADFFVQVCGGRSYFNENRGKPMMASRHAQFKINTEARTVWLNCYSQVLTDLDISDELKQSFWNYLNVFSTWMVNTKDE